MATRVSFGILGPLLVVIDGSPFEIRAPKQRALLATLLLAKGQSVSVTRLVEALWGPAPPASADHLIQVYVSELRAQLREAAADDRLQTDRGGYRIAASAESDASRFEALLARAGDEADAGMGEQALATLREALGLWRGEVLGDVVLHGAAALDAQRLADLRLVALEQRIESELDHSGARNLVPELERLAAEYPFRERLISLLMLALYRSGRQTAALEVYRETRRAFATELGVEPGPKLRELEQAILKHDPQLLPSDTKSEGSALPQGRRGVILVSGTAAIVAAVSVAVALAGPGGAHKPTLLHPSAGSLVVVDEARDRLIRVVRLGGAPGPVASGRSTIAVGDLNNRTLELIDPTSLRLERSVGLPDSPSSLEVSGSLVWIGYAYSGRIGWYDSRSDFLSRDFRPTRDAEGLPAMAFSRKRLWVSTRGGALIALAPPTLRVVSASAAGRFSALTSEGHSLWGIRFGAGELLRLAGSTGRLQSSTPLIGDPQGLAPAQPGIWVVTARPDRLYRIDSRGEVSWLLPLGITPSGVAAGRRSVWVSAGDMLLHIDPTERRLVSTLDLGRPIHAIAAGDKGHLLVTLD